MPGFFEEKDHAPSTPPRPGGRRLAQGRFDDLLSTTPSGAPSISSYTPAGVPSDNSYMGMAGGTDSMMTGESAAPQFMFGQSTTDPGRNLFTGVGSAVNSGGAGSRARAGGVSSPLGKSIHGARRNLLDKPKPRTGYETDDSPGGGFAPAGSSEVPENDYEDYEDEEGYEDEYYQGEGQEGEGDDYYDDEEEGDAEGEEDGEGEEDEEEYEDDEEELEHEEGSMEMEEEEPEESIEATMGKIIDRDLAATHDAEEEEDEDEDDYFLNIAQDVHGIPKLPTSGYLDTGRPKRGFSETGLGGPTTRFDDTSDLMLLGTPAATERIRREAEDIFRATERLSINGGRGQAGFRCASLAKNLYQELGFAVINESSDLILKTEDLLTKVYRHGVGAEDDAAKLDESLSLVVTHLCRLWEDYKDELPQPQGDQIAEIGPGRYADPFEKATFVAQLVLRLHHSRFRSSPTHSQTPPLPETLFVWQKSFHNHYPSQISDMLAHQPSPASHGLFWQVLRSALIHGDVRSAHDLLDRAGWEHQRKGMRDLAYKGQTLDNVRQAVAATCDMLNQCPGTHGNWDIWGDDWNLFRVQAEGSLRKLRLLAEGAERGLWPARGSNPSTMANMARKADSQLPWDIYENLQTVYEIVLGMQSAILETAQDWVEATIGLMGWWDQGRPRQQKSLKMSRSQSARVTSLLGAQESYTERLALALHTVFDNDFHLDASNAVEVATACVLEGNVAAVIGLLRAWSLPVSSAIAEIASLGQWLPKPQAPNPLSLGGVDGLDMDDLEVLGMTQQGPDELYGIKDTTVVQYARELAGIDELSDDMDGWELAIQVLGRMDSAEKSEETIGELLQDLVGSFDSESSPTVDKVWRIMDDLGLGNLAEETAESFADILSRETRRYGEALWYYSLAHRPQKVREVLNLLMSYCLVQSTAYPPAEELDGNLDRLLRERNDTLEQHARQDVEAAQLLGRLLSGYATLRKFYELRDSIDWDKASPARWLTQRRRAASALVAVICSADDNIRGGLYDPDRDSVVSEDFLLALLGEATVFFTAPSGKSSSQQRRNRHEGVPVVTLDQVDTLLKAIEDLETVGPRVRRACTDFFGATLKSAPGGVRGSKPSDLMAMSQDSLADGGSPTTTTGGSFVLAGSSLLASRAHRELAGLDVRRGWDWRTDVLADEQGKDVLKKLRVGLAGELARLWVEEADHMIH